MVFDYAMHEDINYSMIQIEARDGFCHMMETGSKRKT
jgi:hypothetical protein